MQPCVKSVQNYLTLKQNRKPLILSICLGILDNVLKSHIRSQNYEDFVILENILEIDLHPTYFYERFYYAGQELGRHTDRPACEISVTLQISTNLKEPWDIWFQKPDGKETSIKMKSGDAVIYKGCEREHWRLPMKSNYNKLQNKFRTFRKKEDDTYLHQIFFHYVDAQGPYVHYAYDAIKS